MLDRHLHDLPEEEVLHLLETRAESGLDVLEVQARQREYGPNSLPTQPGPTLLMRFLLQFHQPLIYILLAAALITAVLQEWVESGVILGVVLVNAVIGLLQETKAVKALEALAKTTHTDARVLRAGQVRKVDATELVPGDIVLLQSGDKVPADIRLLRARDLQIDESALTGESVAVEKSPERLPEETSLADRKNLAFTSTLVTYGQGRGVVFAIGASTEVGRISELISSAEILETPLTRKLAKFSHVLLVVILALAAVTFILGISRGGSAFDVFMAAVALSVAAIPEGLPAVVTITLAIGVARMARRRAVIRKLPAVETLGSTTTVCSDKTGTLTVNQMTVSKAFAGDRSFSFTGVGYGPEGEIAADDASWTKPVLDNVAFKECLAVGLLCNDSNLEEDEGRWTVQGDPTEGGLLAAASKAGLLFKEWDKQLPRLDSIPFESEYQYMATLHETADGKRTMFVKGAWEVILAKSKDALDADGAKVPFDQEKIREQFEEMASIGLRVLGFAIRELPSDANSISHQDVSDLTFVGLQGMIDPPRSEAIEAVRACHDAGIEVKMITGDHALTARAIADQLGLRSLKGRGKQPPEVMTSTELAGCSDSELIDRIEKISVFARVSPDQKLRLVRALQALGHVVAMTGDGVNDAPALKQADIGVAMGIAGTEVAKESADMVLTDDNFATIEAAVEEGRGVFDNLTKFMVWTLPTNMGEGLVVLAAILLGTALPISPVQILWINMTTAVLLGTMLAFEIKEDDIMQRPPRDPKTPIIGLDLFVRMTIVALILLFGAFGSFKWALAQGYSEEFARTMAVNVFVMVEAFFVFNCRSLTKSMFEIGLFTNPWIPLGVVGVIALQILFTYVPIMNTMFGSEPIGAEAWLRILATGLATYLIIEGEKWLRRKFAPAPTQAA